MTVIRRLDTVLEPSRYFSKPIELRLLEAETRGLLEQIIEE
jgi:hypothetical protein